MDSHRLAAVTPLACVAFAALVFGGCGPQRLLAYDDDEGTGGSSADASGSGATTGVPEPPPTPGTTGATTGATGTTGPSDTGSSGETSSSTGTTSDTESGESDSTTTGEDVCGYGQFPPGQVPATVFGNTDDGTMEFAEGGCSAQGFGQELIWQFEAPAEGFYEFDTIGSEGDTILFLLEETCDGFAFACGDHIDFHMENYASNVGAYLYEGEIIQVVADHWLWQSDQEVVLNVKAVEGDCPDETIVGDLPIVIQDSTEGLTNRITGSCFGEAADIIYQWTAPADASYRMQLTADDQLFPPHDPALYVIDGTSCGGAELACNDDISLGMNLNSRIFVDLKADQDVLIVVDGYGSSAGEFELEIVME